MIYGYAVGLATGAGPGGGGQPETFLISIETGWSEPAVPSLYGIWNPALNGGAGGLENTGVRATFLGYVLAQLEQKYGPACVGVASTFDGATAQWIDVLPAQAIPNDFDLMIDGTPPEPRGFLIYSLYGSPMELEVTQWLSP